MHLTPSEQGLPSWEQNIFLKNVAIHENDSTYMERLSLHEYQCLQIYVDFENPRKSASDFDERKQAPSPKVLILYLKHLFSKMTLTYVVWKPPWSVQMLFFWRNIQNDI
jgi:hypothetical protein